MAVVPYTLENNRHSYAAQDVVCIVSRQNVLQALPCVLGGVLLEEVVLTAVSGELELGADADGGARCLGPGDGLLDVAEVGVEVHRPLIQVAGGHPQQPHLAAQTKNPFPLAIQAS